MTAFGGALEHMPDHAACITTTRDNYACFAALAGDTGDDTFANCDGLPAAT